MTSIFPFEPAPPPPPPKKRKGPIVLAILVGLLVLGVAAVIPGLVDDDDPRVLPESPGLSASPSAKAKQPDQVPSLAKVRRFKKLDRSHVPGPVTYPMVPPAGGPHDEAWLDCGVYDEPVRDENAVHDLEHGTVWITYRPSLKETGVKRLARMLPKNGIMSPYPGLPAKVVVTVWGAQLRLKGVDDPRLPLFLAKFGDGHTSPEPDGSCEGGIKNPADPAGASGSATV